MMTLQKEGDRCKKSKGGHYLAFQGKQSLKKAHCYKEEHFLVYQNKVISKKKNV